MSARVELSRPLHVPADLARDAMVRVARALDARTPPYDRIALSIGLSAMHVPIPASVSAPVTIRGSQRPERYECGLEIAGADAPSLFPTFSGTLSVTPLREYGCELWLQGTYDVPMGELGRLADATLARGAARESLQRLLAWFADEIARAVESDQREERRDR